MSKNISHQRQIWAFPQVSLELTCPQVSWFHFMVDKKMIIETALVTDTMHLGKDDAQLQPRCGQLQKITISYHIKEHITSWYSNMLGKSEWCGQLLTHMAQNGFTDSFFFSSHTGVKSWHNCGWWIEFKGYSKDIQRMAQDNKVLHHVRIFWSFWNDVEIRQSTNLEKHLKVQGLHRFHGLHCLQIGIHCLQIGLQGLSRFHGLQAFPLLDSSITVPSNECVYDCRSNYIELMAFMAMADWLVDWIQRIFKGYSKDGTG